MSGFFEGREDKKGEHNHRHGEVKSINRVLPEPGRDRCVILLTSGYIWHRTLMGIYNSGMARGFVALQASLFLKEPRAFTPTDIISFVAGIVLSEVTMRFDMQNSIAREASRQGPGM